MNNKKNNKHNFMLNTRHAMMFVIYECFNFDGSNVSFNPTKRGTETLKKQLLKINEKPYTCVLMKWETPFNYNGLKNGRSYTFREIFEKLKYEEIIHFMDEQNIYAESV